MLQSIKPGTFVRIADKLLIPVTAITALTFSAGIYYALFNSPPDYQQGDSVRIMYIHVPSAYMAMFIYVFMAVASISFLVWKNPLSEMMASVSAPIGACFTFVTLVTGSLWGKPIWGAWWVWDARLTSVLILFFLYLGYMALLKAFDDHERGAKSAAILCLVGAVNIPIIKFSVEWWNTLHQPASIGKFAKPDIDPSMLIPLIIMIVSFNLLFLIIMAVRVKSEVLERKIIRLQKV